jgi:hypothetical protein
MVRWVVAVAVCTAFAGCTDQQPNAPTEGQSPRVPTSLTSSAPTGSVAAMRRPLRLPVVGGGQPCPVTRAQHQPDPALGVVQGSGPAGPAGLSTDGVLQYAGPKEANAFVDESWGGAKTLWEVDGAVTGPVLVRGHQLDGPLGLRFNDPAVDELVLAVKTPTTPAGWRDYPSFTRLQGPGCYAYQVDAPTSSTVIVFRAEGPEVDPGPGRVAYINEAGGD